MPRRGNVPKRDVLPDPLYNSKLVTKLVNSIMLDGKKGVSQKVVYGAFDIVRERPVVNRWRVFTEAMENIMPTLEVKARRVGATYQVPMEVRPERRQTPACVGSPSTPALVLKRPCVSVWQARSWTLATIWAVLLRSARIPTRWQRRTRRSHTTAINLSVSA